eukprot:m.205382 g.205382  ORF g.205382 m.205382 type:complete len:53 (+) comp15532_c1_seq8:4097-4255(+)
MDRFGCTLPPLCSALPRLLFVCEVRPFVTNTTITFGICLSSRTIVESSYYPS